MPKQSLTCLFNNEKRNSGTWQTTAAATSSDKIAHLLKRDSIYQQFPVCLLVFFLFFFAGLCHIRWDQETCRQVCSLIQHKCLDNSIVFHAHHASQGTLGTLAPVTFLSRSWIRLEPPAFPLTGAVLSVTDGIKWGFRIEWRAAPRTLLPLLLGTQRMKEKRNRQKKSDGNDGNSLVLV